MLPSQETFRENASNKMPYYLERWHTVEFLGEIISRRTDHWWHSHIDNVNTCITIDNANQVKGDRWIYKIYYNGVIWKSLTIEKI